MDSHQASLDGLGRRLRHPAEIVAQWEGAGDLDPELVRSKVRGPFWDLLAELGGSLLVSREYEHFVLALGAPGGHPEISYLRLPHPSGIAVNAALRRVDIAATRNPNQVITLTPTGDGGPGEVLMPSRTTYYPGRFYLHDLAWVGRRLMGTSVGQNTVVDLSPRGGGDARWWPRSVERNGRPDTTINYLQLNSIAAGRSLSTSYFTASAAAPGPHRPGQLAFKVDGTGVLFSGATREPLVTGLTRPHSARFHGADAWLDNSGYGEVGVVKAGRFQPVARLDGWTRGLCFVGGTAIVATSRVIPRFRRYAPGLRRESCGLHLLDVATGDVKASLTWPAGSQVFAIEWLPPQVAGRLPFMLGLKGKAARARQAQALFYSFTTGGKA